MIPKDAIAFSVWKDGDMFCAILTNDFINMQESHCGYGPTMAEALTQLLLDMELAS